LSLQRYLSGERKERRMLSFGNSKKEEEEEEEEEKKEKKKKKREREKEELKPSSEKDSLLRFWLKEIAS